QMGPGPRPVCPGDGEGHEGFKAFAQRCVARKIVGKCLAQPGRSKASSGTRQPTADPPSCDGRDRLKRRAAERSPREGRIIRRPSATDAEHSSSEDHMTIKVGDRIPNATLNYLKDGVQAI